MDDDEDTRELLAVVLQEAGAEVRSAGDVTEALQFVHGWSPCVVLSDLGLPKFDGFALLRELR